MDNTANNGKTKARQDNTKRPNQTSQAGIPITRDRIHTRQVAGPSTAKQPGCPARETRGKPTERPTQPDDPNTRAEVPANEADRPTQPDHPDKDTVKNVKMIITQFRQRGEILLCADANSKSAIWGSSTEDKRGELFAEMRDAMDLTVMNAGNAPTFDGPRGTSFVDVTAASLGIFNNIPEIDSMSDHRYIEIRMNGTAGRVIEREGFCNKKADRDMFRSTYAEICGALHENIRTCTNGEQLEAAEKATNDSHAPRQCQPDYFPADERTDERTDDTPEQHETRSGNTQGNNRDEGEESTRRGRYNGKRGTARFCYQPGAYDGEQMLGDKNISADLEGSKTASAAKGGGYNANQYGFTRERSAVDAVVNKVKKSREKKQYSTIVSLDVTGAFDNAWWPLIIPQLARRGCPGNLLGLARSYLSERTASIHGQDGKEMLPEGCNLMLYADDTMPIFRADTYKGLKGKTTQALNTLKEWANREIVGRRKTSTATKEELQRQLGIDATQIEGETHCTGANAVHPANVGIGAFKEADDEEEETHNVIYTDGAKTAEGAGAAFILYTGQHKTAHKKLMLAKECGAFQCELVAIPGALSYIREYGIIRCTIKTDSKSALQALQGMRIPTQLTRDIEKLANELARTTNLQWRWTKGQAGNTGNERADQLAKEAAAGDPANATSYDLGPISMVRKTLRAETMRRWDTRTRSVQRVPDEDWEDGRCDMRVWHGGG
ncbi:hypothetical protein CBL_20410 [Carabus blaptoides fortunei]